MTTQHAPPTPLWRQFLSLPQTRLGWWAIGLVVPFLFLNGLAILGWTLPLPKSVGMAIGFTVFLVGLPGAILGLIAVGHRDRSLLVWVAQVPGVIFFAFVIWGMSSISLGHGANPWITAPIAILLWAVMVFNIWMSTRLGRKRS